MFDVLTMAAVAGLLAAESRGSRAGVWIFKPLASTGFVGAAVAAGALGSAYGRAVVVALVLSWLGDVLLIPRSRACLRAGILSFLLGHVAFALAFVVRGVDVFWVFGALLVLAPVAVVVLRSLGRHLGDDMRAAVTAYVAVIAGMVACAAGTFGAAGDARIVAGATAFFVSDLSVARDRFVARAFVNRAWGLPLYYGAQLLLAASASVA